MSEAESVCVLYVDDEPDFAELVVDLLEREDDRFTVETATSVRKGLDRVTADDFDCIVSDYNMPGKNGIEFLEAIREEYPDLPFILYTGKGSEEVASDAISAGATGYLQKGGGTDQYELLANRIQNAVEQYHASHRAAELDRIRTLTSDIEQALVRAESREEIEARTCEIISESDPYLFAWIGQVDSDTDRIEPRAWAGVEESYLDDITVSADDTATGRGPGGTALRENRVAVSQDVAEDPEFEPWHEDALERGFQAVAAVPLEYEDTLYGELVVYADRPRAFDEAEEELLAELGTDIAHTIHSIELQAELREQHEFIEQALDALDDLVYVVGTDGALRRWNKRASEVTGYTDEEIAGIQVTDLFPEDDQGTVAGGVEKALTAGSAVVEADLLAKDGERIPYEFTGSRLTNADGDVTGLIGTGRDITERKKQKRRREQIIARVTDAIVEVSSDWEFTLVNEQAEDLYDMDESDLLGRDFWEVFQEAQDTRFEAEYRQVMETREPTSFVEYFSQLDGWFDIEAYPTEDGGIAFYFVEVTEQRERQQELEQANTVLSTLFETLPVGVLAEDSDRTALAVNDYLFELFELPGSPDEVEGADCEQMAEQVSEMFVDSERFVERINDLVVSREPTDFEEVALKDGRTFERSYRPIEFPDGVGHLWVYRDSTERTDLKQQLEELNQISQELMSADAQEEVVEIGVETARDLLGMDSNSIHLYDEDADELVPAAITDAAIDLIGEPPTFTGDDSIAWRVYQRGESLAVDDVSEDSDRHNPDTPIRSELYLSLGDYGVLLAGSPSPETFDEQDVLLGEILAGGLATALEQVERTEQLRARERELTHQNDRLKQFASIVSHDLRNPLNVAEGRLELAATECNSEQLDSVKQAHERMRALIDDLLTLAREGESETDIEPVALDPLGERCWASVETDAATLVLDTEQTVQADRSRMKQLFENLMRNAIEHGSEDVTVRVGALNDGLYVEDDGAGIPADKHDDIFEAGYSTSREGTGFGLSIVKQIAEAHNWEIHVTDGDGGGARFEITGVEFAAE